MHHPLFDVILSPLDRVIAVGQTIEAVDVAVELTALEIRQAGAIAFWRARPAQELALLDADVRVSSRNGNDYESTPAGHEGSALHWSGQSVFMPAPPVGTRLVIEILSFGPPIDHEVPRGVSMQHIHGPWRFTVDT